MHGNLRDGNYIRCVWAGRTQADRMYGKTRAHTDFICKSHFTAKEIETLYKRTLSRIERIASEFLFSVSFEVRFFFIGFIRQRRKISQEKRNLFRWMPPFFILHICECTLRSLFTIGTHTHTAFTMLNNFRKSNSLSHKKAFGCELGFFLVRWFIGNAQNKRKKLRFSPYLHPSIDSDRFFTFSAGYRVRSIQTFLERIFSPNILNELIDHHFCFFYRNRIRSK